MIVEELLEELKTANHPVAKALHTGNHFRVLVITKDNSNSESPGQCC